MAEFGCSSFDLVLCSYSGSLFGDSRVPALLVPRIVCVDVPGGSPDLHNACQGL